MFSVDLSALVVGSTTNVTWQGATVFPAADNDNTILGFTFMTDGFTLQDQTTTLTYNAVLPVVGEVVLNGGLLYLNQDVVLSNITTFTSLGNVSGQSHRLSLASAQSVFGASNEGLFDFDDLELVLNGNLLFNANVEFNGNSTIDGQNYLLDLGSTSSIIVGSNSTLVLKNVTIQGAQNTNISCVDNTGVIILDNVNFIQSDNFVFPFGALQFNDQVNMQGNGFVFVYESVQTSSIQPDARLTLDSDITFSYAPAVADNSLLQLTESTSELRLNGSTLFATTAGLQLTQGKLTIDGKSFLSNDAVIDAQAIQFGDGVSPVNNLTVKLLPAATLELIKGRVVYNNV